MNNKIGVYLLIAKLALLLTYICLQLVDKCFGPLYEDLQKWRQQQRRCPEPFPLVDLDLLSRQYWHSSIG